MASANLIILVGNIGRVEVKTFQDGGKIIREMGYPLESLAIVESMDHNSGTVKFREQ